jgi:hypothetical protein
LAVAGLGGVLGALLAEISAVLGRFADMEAAGSGSASEGRGRFFAGGGVFSTLTDRSLELLEGSARRLCNRLR